MGEITLLLGKTRARRRRAMARQPVGANRAFPDFLYLAATQRKRDRVEAEFLAW